MPPTKGSIKKKRGRRKREMDWNIQEVAELESDTGEETGLDQVIIKKEPSDVVEESLKAPSASTSTSFAWLTEVEAGSSTVASSKSNERRFTCIVVNCPNTSDGDQNLQFYTLPGEQKRINLWMTLAGRRDLVDKSGPETYICDAHFPPEAFEIRNCKKMLKSTVLPTLMLPEPDPLSETFDAVLMANKGVQCEIVTSKQCSLIKQKKLVLASKFKKKMTKEKQWALFSSLCDKFLNTDISLVVKAQLDMKNLLYKERKCDWYTTFCLCLYHTSPATYMALQKTMYLPTKKSLRVYSTASMKFTNILKLMNCLKPKIEAMTELERYCSVQVFEVELKPHLYYHIREDKLYGLCRVGTELSPQVARYAVVLMVRGLFANWTLPIDYALFYTKGNRAVSKWVRSVLGQLLREGLNVRICQSNMSSSIFSNGNNTAIPVKMPYFSIQTHDIYYTYDPTYLLKIVYKYFKDHEFHFQGMVAKWQDILQFYDNDSKKSHRLVPELTEKHVRPDEGDSVEAHIVVETLSERVAAGIANYVEFGQMDETAMGTVHLLTMMSRIYKFMTSTYGRVTCEYQKPYTGTEFQLNFVMEALMFVRNLKIKKDGVNVSSEVKFLKHIQISLRATMLLFEHLTLNNVGNICTNNITLIIPDFLDKIIQKSKTKDITAWRLISAFRKKFYNNILKTSKKKACPEVATALFQNYLAGEKMVGNLENYKTISKIPLPVTMADYKDYKLPAKDQIISISKFLVTKCMEKHPLCSLPKTHNGRKGFFGQIVVPSDATDNSVNNELIRFVAELDADLKEAFDKYLERNYLISKVKSYPMPATVNCACFPIHHLIHFFFRLTTSLQLKLNNQRFRKSPSDEILYFEYQMLK